MSAVLRHLPILMLATTLILVGCPSDSPDNPSSTGQSRRSLDSDLGEICSGLGETIVDPDDYISEEVAVEPFCREWLAKQEMYLCGAYYYFNRATSLSTIGETWPARLAHFRNAVEHILDVILDTQDVEDGFWQKGYLEKEIMQPGSCGMEPIALRGQRRGSEPLVARSLARRPSCS